MTKQTTIVVIGSLRVKLHLQYDKQRVFISSYTNDMLSGLVYVLKFRHFRKKEESEYIVNGYNISFNLSSHVTCFFFYRGFLNVKKRFPLFFVFVRKPTDEYIMG